MLGVPAVGWGGHLGALGAALRRVGWWGLVFPLIIAVFFLAICFAVLWLHLWRQ